MAQGPPSFQFYAKDFITDEDVVLMPNQAVGCYIKLLCHSWLEGSIPAEIAKIAKLCGETPDVMAQLWLAISSKFVELADKPSRLVNPRQETVRKTQQEYRLERAASGAKGAKARWDKRSTDFRNDGSANSFANGSAMEQPIAKDASSSSSPSSFKEDIPTAAIAPDPEKVACLEAINKRFPTWCLSGKEWDRLLDYGEAVSWPVLRKAVDICLGSGSTDIRFYNGICKRWDEQGVKSLEDAEIAQAKFEAQKQRAKERATERTQAKDKTPRAFSSLQVALEQAEREEREAGTSDQG